MSYKSFEKWELDELHRAFGLKRHYKNFKPLEEWLNIPTNISTTDKVLLDKLKEKAMYNIDYWNEDELKFFFIGRLVDICELDSPHYKIFTQRSIKATINDIELKGIVDFVIAKGLIKPEKPFFFLHEYKQEKTHINDPLAQLLSAMLVAQVLNEKKHPLYGCYVLGRLWFFVVLKDNEYAVSLAYDATQDDIYQIAALMREARNYILDILGVSS